MQLLDGRFVYSATDLNNYLECGRLVALERDVALDARVRPEKDATAELIARKGIEHEIAELARLRERYPDLVEISQSGRGRGALEAAAAATEDAMAAGARVIYQGTFFDGTFLGKSDFLLRVERPSGRWPWGYEVADTKLALADKPYFIVQLAHYSEHVARVQGSEPESMQIVLGNGRRTTYRVADSAAYYRRLKAAFLAREPIDAYPLPCEHCAICSWAPECAARRAADDHLSLVAGMRRALVGRFETAGIETLGALARPEASRPYGMQPDTFARVHRQASLQARGRASGRNLYELLEQRPALGFGLLPQPASGDVYFDMEGDPFFDIGTGLEYLFGLYCPGDDMPFVAFWGTDRAGEKRAFEACVDFLIARRERYPEMHAYHYAPYEKTALRRLSQRHATREDEIDALLRGEVLVDLYAVVRQSVAVSQSGYSIKKLEPYYGLRRSAGVKKGDDSVVAFETWLADPARSEILAQIERYNEEDCRSTHLLHEWLLALRREYGIEYGGEPAFRPLRDPLMPCHAEFTEGCNACVRRRREEREAAQVAEDAGRLAQREGDAAATLLGHLLSYHRREEKPAWWRLFDRCDNVDDLREFDHEAIGGLELRADVAPFKRKPGDRNAVYTYSFPEQTQHLGDRPVDPATRKSAGELIEIDLDTNTLTLKRAGTLEQAAALHALVPGGPVVADVQKEALARAARAYLEGDFAKTYPAAADLLRAAPPRLRGTLPGTRVQPEHVTPESVYATVARLDGSYLVVQGPPGSGKTYTGARVIVNLLRAGKRVGIMAGGHKAIHTMLHAVERYAAECSLEQSAVRGVHKHSRTSDGSPYVSRETTPYVTSVDDNAAATGGAYNLVSGTSWLFAREDMVQTLDVLVIDEAGQTSLADAVAVALCARDVVLLGDPMQLAQVAQGSHPGGAGRSALRHLLGEASTVDVRRGILLDVSYRMQPEICAFISATSYDGRLRAAPATAGNRIDAPGLGGAGLRYLPVVHAGNARESAEEANAIAACVARALHGTVSRDGLPPRPLEQTDILIVTPYNAQRKRIEAALRARGYDGVRVGTVDKFQGQEAPIVFYSMATSSGDDVPRTLEFLFEKNRFNVAVSRAQCLSVLVCAPALLEVRCTNAAGIELVNVVCRYVETAHELATYQDASEGDRKPAACAVYEPSSGSRG